jgi:hypothetical protein
VTDVPKSKQHCISRTCKLTGFSTFSRISTQLDIPRQHTRASSRTFQRSPHQSLPERQHCRCSSHPRQPILHEPRHIGSIHRVGKLRLRHPFVVDLGNLHRFFTYYHPSIPIILSARDPESVYERSELLFWTICAIGSRPRSDHSLERARAPELCIHMREEVKKIVSHLLIEPCDWYYSVQALVLICEFPFAAARFKDDLCWVSPLSSLRRLFRF